MNKKIAGLLFILSFLGLCAFAQTESREDENIKYEPRDWGMGFHIDGIISNIALGGFERGTVQTIQIRKFIDDRWAVRVDFGINAVNYNEVVVDSAGSFQRTYDSTYSRTDFHFAPTFEYHFEGTKRLDPYVGMGLSFGIRGRETRNASTDLQDTIGTANTTRNYNMPGGFTFGAGLTAGFNYFIAPRFALGAEYNMRFIADRTGGDFDIVTINRPVTGASVTSRRTGSDRSASNNFTTHGSVNITLTYFFSMRRKSSENE